jgi:threonine 3-dehydrogenase
VVPSDIPVGLATLMEPLGVAVRAVTETPIAGANVLVVGCGPIGLFCVAAAKRFGASRVIATDLSPPRLDLAEQLGAERALQPGTRPLRDDLPAAIAQDRFDVVIETSGSEAAFHEALTLVRSGGEVVFASLPDKPFTIEIKRDLVLREITLRGVYGRRIDATWVQVERFLLTDGERLSRVLTHRMPLSDFDAAFALAESGAAGKVVLEP